MFCVKCGKTLEPNAHACPDCGTKVVLPEGYIPESESIVTIDVDMLTGEKTVAADHNAIARKAAENAQPAKPSANAPAFQAPPPVAMPEKPKFSTGFDLNSAKKIMNGRSILIDDSPAPSAMPAFASPSAAVQNTAESNNKKYIVVIIAAIAVIAVALGAILFVLFSQNGEDDGDNDSRSEKTTTETAVSETAPFNSGKEENPSKNYFEENTTLGDIGQARPTKPSSNIITPLIPDNEDSSEEQTDAITEVTQKPEENEPDEPHSGIGIPEEAPSTVTLPEIPSILFQ
ncbi:MAG: zinc ribbon domain-containing protein [Clostridia bacterium]|nr:zinc ribbon domain-containing protein [Clostridia bacterium]